MREKNEVMNELKSIPTYNIVFTKKELNYLPEILSNDEHVLSLISGTMDGNTWLIALTGKRIIFLDKGMIYGLKQREIPLNKINSILQKKGLLLGSVIIQDGATAIKIDNIDKKCISPFVDALNNAIEAQKSATSNVQFAGAQQSQSGADEIMKYKNLMDEGIITKEEFEIKKKQILGI